MPIARVMALKPNKDGSTYILAVIEEIPATATSIGKDKVFSARIPHVSATQATHNAVEYTGDLTLIPDRLPKLNTYLGKHSQQYKHTFVGRIVRLIKRIDPPVQEDPVLVE